MFFKHEMYYGPDHDLRSIATRMCDMLVSKKGDSNTDLKNQIQQYVAQAKYKFDSLDDYYNFANAVRTANVEAVTFFIEIGNNPFDKNNPFHDHVRGGSSHSIERYMEKLKSNQDDTSKEMIKLLTPYMEQVPATSCQYR